MLPAHGGKPPLPVSTANPHRREEEHRALYLPDTSQVTFPQYYGWQDLDVLLLQSSP